MAEDVITENGTFLFNNLTSIDLWDITVESSPEIDNIDTIVLSCIFSLALFGNLVVVAVLLWRRFGPCRFPNCSDLSRAPQTYISFRLTNIQWFILFLSFADICVAFFTILSQIIWDVTRTFVGNDFTCRIVKYLQVVPMYLSTYTMVMLAIDRYISVCYPSVIFQWEHKRVTVLLSIAWGVAFILGLPQIFIFSLKEIYPGYLQCWGNFDPEWTVKLYVTTFSTIIFLAPLIILIFCYGRICFVILGYSSSSALHNPTFQSNQRGERCRTVIFNSNLNPDERFNNTDQSINIKFQKKISAAKVKTVKMSLAIIFFHIICWAPFIIVQLWSVYDETAPINLTVMLVIMRIANLSSCVNPWIYLAFGALLGTSIAKLDSANVSLNTDVENIEENTESS